MVEAGWDWGRWVGGWVSRVLCRLYMHVLLSSTHPSTHPPTHLPELVDGNDDEAKEDGDEEEANGQVLQLLLQPGLVVRSLPVQWGRGLGGWVGGWVEETRCECDCGGYRWVGRWVGG